MNFLKKLWSNITNIFSSNKKQTDLDKKYIPIKNGVDYSNPFLDLPKKEVKEKESNPFLDFDLPKREIKKEENISFTNLPKEKEHVKKFETNPFYFEENVDGNGKKIDDTYTGKHILIKNNDYTGRHVVENQSRYNENTSYNGRHLVDDASRKRIYNGRHLVNDDATVIDNKNNTVFDLLLNSSLEKDNNSSYKGKHFINNDTAFDVLLKNSMKKENSLSYSGRHLINNDNNISNNEAYDGKHLLEEDNTKEEIYKLFKVKTRKLGRK